jgi:hypothetical protein
MLRVVCFYLTIHWSPSGTGFITPLCTHFDWPKFIAYIICNGIVVASLICWFIALDIIVKLNQIGWRYMGFQVDQMILPVDLSFPVHLYLFVLLACLCKMKMFVFIYKWRWKTRISKWNQCDISHSNNFPLSWRHSTYFTNLINIIPPTCFPLLVCRG